MLQCSVVTVPEHFNFARDVMERWRSSCPRLTIWEDALSDELITFDDSSGITIVTPTAKGRRLVAQQAASTDKP